MKLYGLENVRVFAKICRNFSPINFFNWITFSSTEHFFAASYFPLYFCHIYHHIILVLLSRV